MAIPIPDLDELPPGPLRSFVEVLHELYDEAGQPAARAISRNIFHLPPSLENVSHETVSAALRGSTVPAWEKIKSIVTALADRSDREHDVQELLLRFNSVWVPARQAMQSRPEKTTGAPDSTARRSTITPSAIPGPKPLQPDRSKSAIRPEGLPGAHLKSAPQLTGTPSVPAGLPGRNTCFTGREVLLERIHAHLMNSQSAPLALYGLVGIGKTQLAREYVARYSQCYSAIWWVPADRVERARDALVGMADQFGIRNHQDVERTVADVKSRLESGMITCWCSTGSTATTSTR